MGVDLFIACRFLFEYDTGVLPELGEETGQGVLAVAWPQRDCKVGAEVAH